MYETFVDKNGTVRRIYNLGRDGQIRMDNNGWTLRIPQTIKRNGWSQFESAQELYDRLSKSYDKVKVYYTGTMIRGIHDYFAYCK